MAYTSTLRKLSENLNTTFENTIFENPTNVGDAREKQVIKYLMSVMAKRYGFGSGEVFDYNDNQSGQIDVIIYDALHSVVFSDGTSSNILAPMESTYGIISVKSQMGTKELNHAIKGVAQYNSLNRTTPQENSIYINPEQPITLTGGLDVKSPQQRNINCIFAFSTTVSQDSILKTVKESECIDLLVVPNKFCVVGRQRESVAFSKNGEKMDTLLIKTENAVPLFTLLLQTYLKTNSLVARDTLSLISWLTKESEVIELK